MSGVQSQQPIGAISPNQNIQSSQHRSTNESWLTYGSKLVNITTQAGINITLIGLNSVIAISTATTSYIKNLQPADTQTLRNTKGQLGKFARIDCKNASKPISIRSQLIQEQRSVLDQLKPTVSSLPEIQRALQLCDQETAQYMQWTKSIQVIQSKTEVALNKLSKNPKNGQVSTAKTILAHNKSALNELANSIILTDGESQNNQRDIYAIAQLGQALQTHQDAVNSLSKTLHLSTGWSDWSAKLRELSDYCIQTENPVGETLASQVHVLKTLSKALEQLVTLKKDMDTTFKIQYYFQKKMNSLASLTSISSQNLDMELMRSQITRTDHLHNEITHRFQNSFTLAQNAVSFVNSKPTKTMQLMALDFTEKLASQVASLHSIDIGLNQGQIHNYLLSTQAIAQQLKDADLIDLTTTQLQQMQPKLG